MTNSKLTILIISLDSYGHINACIGVAEKLLSHGHRVVFALERAWKGQASRYPGIEEVLYVNKTRDPTLGPNDHWIEFMQQFKKKFHLEPLDALKAANLELEEQFLYAMINVDNELSEVIEQVKPDVIVADTYVTIPAVIKSGIPWVWLTSAAPLVSLPSEDLPPHRTGYPTNGDRAQWKEYLRVEKERFGPIGLRFQEKLKEFDLPEEATTSVMHPSPYLNVYAYPEELDYLDIRPLPNETWQRFDHFIRLSEFDPSFKIPDELLNNPLGKLVYVSMGSLGCSDFGLMERLISILSKSPNRFIFSLGSLEAKLRPLLGPNMWGTKFVPQTVVLPLVDLVITHGGNNTFIESLYFGKPMIVTPLFGDQRDNAQRLSEKGYGQRVAPYTCESEELLDKIEQVLSDRQLQERVQTLSKRLQNSNSTEKAAIAVESLASK